MSTRTAGFVALFCMVTGFVFGIAARIMEHQLPHRDPATSWDQDNLKKYDLGCPSSVFIAPHGDLMQCQFSIQDRQWLKDLDDVAHSVMPGYPTMEEAAIEGLKAVTLKPNASWYEWGGMIIKAANGYLALPASTNYSASQVHIDGVPGDIVGSYHTHVCNPHFAHEFFSPQDLMDPIFFHKVAFMGDMCTGLVHRFRPGEKPDVAQAGGGGPYSSMGWIVGKFTKPAVVQ